MPKVVIFQELGLRLVIMGSVSLKILLASLVVVSRQISPNEVEEKRRIDILERSSVIRPSPAWIVSL